MVQTTPPVPSDESARLFDLQALGILDTPPEIDFDRLVQLAAMICGTPLGAISFVDAQRQWFKARVGLEVVETPRATSFCAHAISEPRSLMEVADTDADARFRANAFSAGKQPVRFYAGVPLQTRAGSAVGTLCVMDTVPRMLSAAQRDALQKLADTASAQLASRREVRTLRLATQLDRRTGLPTWFQFESEFDHVVAAHEFTGLLVLVRLKTLGPITWAHGFRTADEMLVQTARRLRAFVGENGLVGRIKRELFIVYMPGHDAATFAAETAPALAATLLGPYEVDGLSLLCRVQMGIAVSPRDGDNLDEIVTAADTALRVAMEQDEPLMFFDRDVDNLLSRHYRLEPELRSALGRDEFVNYYQPKVDLATGAIVGVEALIRWRHPERGLIPPLEFIPALELTGLIALTGAQVIRRALADWLAWKAAGLAAPRIAVNVTAGELRDERFVHELKAALADAGGAAGALLIEVTEGILIRNMDRTIDILAQVRALGIPVALDDFGTGYSSLAYLVSLPIDELKVDRSFIQQITTYPAHLGVVDTCITLAHRLKLTVVAEGVETQEQADLLRSLHCDQAQGFLYSRPVSADELAMVLAEGRSLAPR
ncbi:MAG TPA: sensor domain-containing phosphodiesterase [Ramlibacter sp.]